MVQKDDNPKKPTPPEDELPAQEVAEADPEAAIPPGGAAAVDDFTLLQRERDELHSRLLRVSADYQNYVRRSQQNLTDARDQQSMAMAKKLLTVLDHFDRALAVDPAKTSIESLLQGVQIVRDELLRVLENFDIRRLEAQPGEEFDPTRHEALMRQHVEGMAPNHVAQQLEPGYALGDKTLRPAKVSITE